MPRTEYEPASDGPPMSVLCPKISTGAAAVTVTVALPLIPPAVARTVSTGVPLDGGV